MKSPEQIAVEKARELPAKERALAVAQWDIVCEEYETRMLELPLSKRPKSFEVHHLVTKARAAFLEALVAGEPLEGCASAARAILK
mgnify:CR=1 FL=1